MLKKIGGNGPVKPPANPEPMGKGKKPKKNK